MSQNEIEGQFADITILEGVLSQFLQEITDPHGLLGLDSPTFAYALACAAEYIGFSSRVGIMIRSSRPSPTYPADVSHFMHSFAIVDGLTFDVEGSGAEKRASMRVKSLSEVQSALKISEMETEQFSVRRKTELNQVCTVFGLRLNFKIAAEISNYIVTHYFKALFRQPDCLISKKFPLRGDQNVYSC